MNREKIFPWLFVLLLSLLLIVFVVEFDNHSILKRISYSDSKNTLQGNNDALTKVSRLLGDAHHEKMYGYNDSAHHAHEKAWMALEVVDGLRNEDVVMMVTSSEVKDFHYLRERILPGARTWMRMFANVLIVIEDTFHVHFAMRHCRKIESARFTTFECHNEPIYVLSRKCNNHAHGGPGPCCKVDDLFTYLTTERPDLFAHTKFAIHADDDTYFRPDQTLRWLAAIEESGMNTFPIIANGNPNDPKENVWHIKGCEEIHTNGWYQPMMLNHAALDRLKVASQNYGFADTCTNFELTHDVGMGPYAWLFGFYHTQFVGSTVQNSGGRDQLNPHNQAIHAMKHGRRKDDCDKVEQWPEKDRYNQKMVIGCGTIDTPSPGHEPNGIDFDREDGSKGESIVADMYDGWHFYKEKGQSVDVHNGRNWEMRKVVLYPKGTMLPGISTTGDEDKIKVKKILTDSDLKSGLDAQGRFEGLEVVDRNVLKLQRLEGYDTTEHSKKYDITKVWHEFKLSDCKIKGSVNE